MYRRDCNLAEKDECENGELGYVDEWALCGEEETRNLGGENGDAESALGTVK